MKLEWAKEETLTFWRRCRKTSGSRNFLFRLHYEIKNLSSFSRMQCKQLLQLVPGGEIRSTFVLKILQHEGG